METTNEIPEILENVLFTKINLDNLRKSKVSKILPLLFLLAEQNNLNLKIPIQNYCAGILLTNSVLYN